MNHTSGFFLCICSNNVVQKGQEISPEVCIWSFFWGLCVLYSLGGLFVTSWRQELRAQRWWIDVQCYRFKHQPLLQSCHYQFPLILFLLAPHVYIPSTLHLPCLYQQWTLLQVGDHVLMALMMSRTAGTCTSCLLYALWFVHSMGATLWGSWYKHLCKWASFHLLLWVMIQ